MPSLSSVTIRGRSLFSRNDHPCSSLTLRTAGIEDGTRSRLVILSFPTARLCVKPPESVYFQIIYIANCGWSKQKKRFSIFGPMDSNSGRASQRFPLKRAVLSGA